MLNNGAPTASTSTAARLRVLVNKVRIKPSQRVGLVAGILAILCFVVAGLNFRWVPYSVWKTPFDGLNWTLAGSLLITISLFNLRAQFPQFAITQTLAKTYAINWIIVALSLLALFILGYVNYADLAAKPQHLQLDQHLQFFLLVAGSAGLMLGFGGFIRLKPLFSFQTTKPVHLNLLIAGVVLLCLLAFVQLVAGIEVHPVLTVVLILLGFLLILNGAGFVTQLNFIQLNLPALDKPRLTPHVLTLIAIVIVGFFLRVWQLDTAVHTTVDEMHFWTGLLALRDFPDRQILKPIDHIATFTHLYPYFQSFAVQVFGPDLFAMRFPSAIIGTLMILATYFLVSVGLDRKTALIAAALLAIFPPHIHFSRTALNNIADPLMGTLAIAFLIHGLKYNSQRSYVIAGVCLGWTALFYEGGRLLFLGFFLAYLGLLMVTKRPWLHIRNWMLLGICAFVISVPYYYTMSQMGQSFGTRFTEYFLPELQKYVDVYTTNNSLPAALQRYYDDSLKFAFYHIFYSPDGSKIYYGGQAALLTWLMVPLFFLGIFLSVFVIRRFGFLILLWIVLTALGVSLVPGSDWTARLVVYFVPIVVLLAMGLRYTLEILIHAAVSLSRTSALTDDQTASLTAQSKVLLYALIGVFIVGAGAYQLKQYFTTHLDIYNREVRVFPYDFLDAFYRAVEADPNSHLVYVGTMDSALQDMSGKDLDAWIRFKEIPMSVEMIDVSAFTAEKVAQLAETRREKTLIFALEPSVLTHDLYGQPLENPTLLPANQQAYELIAHSFPEARGDSISHYATVPLNVQYQLLIVPHITDPALPVLVTPVPTPETQAAVSISSEPVRCVSVIGEAAASGFARVNVPPSGSWTIRFQPLSFYLRQKLDEQGLQDVPLQDRTTVAGAIGSGITNAVEDYLRSAIYQQLLADHCRVNVMMPWISDLTSTTLPSRQAASQYVDRLTKLLYDLLLATPDTRILLVKYYPAQASEFMQATDGGVTMENVALYNQRLEAICNSENPDWQRVTCIDPQDAFADLGQMYLLTALTYQDIQADIAADQTMILADTYFGENPDKKTMLADGIHLSRAGKLALANRLAEQIKRIFAP